MEFCLPHDINLDGVEFKSMASGSHRVTNDFMYVFPLDRQEAGRSASTPHPCSFASPSARYFRKGCYFGLACFANMPVESELERGARMKSVGILCPSYTLLYRYMHFLENQVRWDASLVCLSILAPGGPSCLCPVYRVRRRPVPTSRRRPCSCCFFLPSIKHESRSPGCTRCARAERTRPRRRLRPPLNPAALLCSALLCPSRAILISRTPGCHGRSAERSRVDVHRNLKWAAATEAVVFTVGGLMPHMMLVTRPVRADVVKPNRLLLFK